MNILLPDFARPDASFIDEYATHLADSSALAQHGITIDRLKESARFLLDCPEVAVESKVDAETMKDPGRRRRATHAHIVSESILGVCVCILGRIGHRPGVEGARRDRGRVGWVGPLRENPRR